MEPFESYQKYLALKNHFTYKNYNYFTYHGKVKANLKSFYKRNDRFYFEKLSRQKSDEEIINFFVANFVSSGKTWVGDLTSLNAEKIFSEWKKNKESMQYHLTEDLKFLKDSQEDPQKAFEVQGGSHPPLLKFLLGKKIRMETVIATNRVLGFIDKWNKQIEETFIWPNVSRTISKYDPFVKLNTQNIRIVMRKELL